MPTFLALHSWAVFALANICNCTRYDFDGRDLIPKDANVIGHVNENSFGRMMSPSLKSVDEIDCDGYACGYCHENGSCNKGYVNRYVNDDDGYDEKSYVNDCEKSYVKDCENDSHGDGGNVYLIRYGENGYVIDANNLQMSMVNRVMVTTMKMKMPMLMTNWVVSMIIAHFRRIEHFVVLSAVKERHCILSVQSV